MTKFCTKLRVSAARLGDDIYVVGEIKVIDFGPVADDHEFGADADGFLHIEGNAMGIAPGAGRRGVVIDSVSWACRDCHRQMIGARPPDDLCGPCLAVRLACEEPR